MNASSDNISTLHFAAAVSTDEETQSAVQEVGRTGEQLDGAADLAVVFVSPHHGPDFGPLIDSIHDQLGPACLIGCTGESIVGGAREVEQGPAVSLWLARLPGVTLHPMHLRYERTGDGGGFTGWPDDLPQPWPGGAALLLLGEPFTFPADVLLHRLNEDQPNVPIIGGMASGSFAPGENRVFVGGEPFDHGAAGLLVHGDVAVRSFVSQGCRPVGQHFVVTAAERNVIRQLGGRPAAVQLQELFDSLPPDEQRRLQAGPHVGIVINEYQDSFHRGDFLVRNIAGIERETGGIVVGDYVRVGQTIQFHVRDAQSAGEDLAETLRPLAGGQHAHRGALLFTCNGRGSRLFPEPDHDAKAVSQSLHGAPLAGFFAQGEIGPVGGKNFLHGFTASLAVFEQTARNDGGSLLRPNSP